MVTVYDALGVIADFDDSIEDATFDTPQIQKHLQQMVKLNFKIPDFKQGLDWLNVSQALSFNNHLKGQIVVLDFFTYCCINCMHILPDLEAVEELFPASKGVTVVGVHSAKFLNEKVTANILSAVLRYGIHHPVVNDKDASLWQEMAVACWPTLVFVGPSGNLLYTLAGEGHRSKIVKFLEVAVDFFTASGELEPKALPVSLETEKLNSSYLSFPGKVHYWSEKQWLLISDTGNHRIIITDSNGIVQAVVGSGCRGFKDGSKTQAEFSSPQGIVAQGNSIYVADTDNHSLREIRISDFSVRTLSGTGQQGSDKEGGLCSTQQELSSPWDLALGTSPGADSSHTKDILFIAMAGTHQIWVYFLADADWYKKKHYSQGTCLRFAGSGREENRNNAYPDKASFAQPSGLAVSEIGALNKLYVADSESSSVRWVDLGTGKVSGLVGGEKDPMNLFAFGDEDGMGTIARLQHPLAVSLLSSSGPLIVADSYNHKIKQVDLTTNACTTLAGTGQAGSQVDTQDLTACGFSEPGGLSVAPARGEIYIADTNNHLVKVIDFSSKTLTVFPVIPADDLTDSSGDIVPLEDTSSLPALPPVSMSCREEPVVIKLNLDVSEGKHINLEAPNSWKILPADEHGRSKLKDIPSRLLRGKLTFSNCHNEASFPLTFPPTLSPGLMNLKLSIQIFYCLDADNVCLPPVQKHFKQPVNIV